MTDSIPYVMEPLCMQNPQDLAINTPNFIIILGCLRESNQLATLSVPILGLDQLLDYDI